MPYAINTVTSAWDRISLGIGWKLYRPSSAHLGTRGVRGATYVAAGASPSCAGTPANTRRARRYRSASRLGPLEPGRMSYVARCAHTTGTTTSVCLVPCVHVAGKPSVASWCCYTLSRECYRLHHSLPNKKQLSCETRRSCRSSYPLPAIPMCIERLGF